LVLDSGNSISTVGRATATSDPSQGELPVEAMNAMGYDAMAVGDRDLNREAAVVAALFQAAEFPLLSANLGPAGVLPNIRPYLLREVNGQTVAIIGVTSPIALQRSDTLGVTLEVESTVRAVGRVVEEVRDSAAVVILLSSLGDEANETLAEQVSGIDAIIGAAGGRQTRPRVVAGPAGQVVLQSSGVQGRSLGVLVLQFDAQGQVVDFSWSLQDLTSEIADDQQMVLIMQKYGVKP